MVQKDEIPDMCVEVRLGLGCVSAIRLGPGCIPVSWLGSG